MNKEIITVIVEEAKTLIITKETMPDAVETLSQLNKQLDAVVAEKEKVTAPLNAALKAERGRWKPYETELEGAIDILRKGMTTYQTQARLTETEEKAKITEKVMEGKLKLETGIRKIGELDSADTKVSTDAGSVNFMSVKKFELVDISKVPVDYLLVNEVAVRKAMKEGFEITGFRYFIEEVPVNRRA